MAPGFPRFSDGDVEIHFSETDEKFVLHSYVLALHSPWFKASLSERWKGSAERQVVSKDVCVYELRFDKGSDLGLFVRKGTETDAEFTMGELDALDRTWTWKDEELFYQRQDVIQAHRDLLSLVYHMPVSKHRSYDIFDCDVEERINALKKIAQSYGVEGVIDLHIRNELVNCRDEMVGLCLEDPVRMLGVATKFQSGWIFREAGAHLMGRSNRFYGQVRESLVELKIAGFFVEKRSQFKATLERIENRLFKMTVGSGTYDHLATSYFRKWLADQLNDNKGSNLGPGYAVVYHRIAQARLQDTQAHRKHQLEAYWKLCLCGNVPAVDDITKLEAAVGEVLKMAKHILAEILASKTSGEHHGSEIHRALTFMIIDDDELPWNKT